VGDGEDISRCITDIILVDSPSLWNTLAPLLHTLLA